MKEFQERMKILLKDDYNLFVEALKKDDQKAVTTAEDDEDE